MQKTESTYYSKYYKEFVAGMASALFFIIEFLPLGILFGTMALDTGLTTANTLGMSSLVFAGASQFLALTLLNTGATAGTIIVATFIVNLRHILMSSYVASAIPKTSVLHRIFTGGLLTDEGFALASQKITLSNNISAWYVLGVNISLYIQWQISTLAGIFLGNIIPGMEEMGIEAILYALFLSIVVLSISKRTDILIAALSAIIAVIITLWGYSSSAVLLASLLASLAGLGVYKWKQNTG